MAYSMTLIFYCSINILSSVIFKTRRINLNTYLKYKLKKVQEMKRKYLKSCFTIKSLVNHHHREQVKKANITGRLVKQKQFIQEARTEKKKEANITLQIKNTLKSPSEAEQEVGEKFVAFLWVKIKGERTKEMSLSERSCR